MGKNIFFFKRWPSKIAYPLKMVQYSKIIFAFSDSPINVSQKAALIKEL